MSQTKVVNSTVEPVALPGPDVITFATEPPGSIELEPIAGPSNATSDEAIQTVDDEEATKQYPTGAAFAFIFLAVSLVLVLGGLDVNIVSTAVPKITDHFHTVADVGWYYTAYRLASGSLQFACGKLYTLFRTKRLFLLFTVVFFVGSLLCATAASSAMFVLGRAITGVGVAGSTAGFFKLMVDIVPLEKRPLYSAMFGMMEGLSGLVAPVIGGAIVQNLSWRWCFYINLPICGAALLMLFFFLPETSKNVEKLTWREALQKMDITGTLILVPSLAALFIALNWGGITYSWSNPRIIALFVVFALLFAAFVVDQMVKKDDAILPMRILKDRNVYAGAIFSACIASSLSILEYYAPTYFQAVLGYSPGRSGVMMLPSLIACMVAILISGSGTSKFGYLNPFMLASSVLMPIGAGLLTTWGPNTSLAKLISYFALSGFAAGVGFMAPQTSVQTSLAEKDIPLGMAVILFFQNFGPALFVAIAQTIFTTALSSNLHRLVPGSNVNYIETLGLSEIRNTFQGEKLKDVILGFSDSISQTWYLAVGLTSFSIVGSGLTRWTSVKKKQS